MEKNSIAHLEVIREATIFARAFCWSGENIELAAALLDAIHNTPGHIVNPLDDNDNYIERYYQSFDNRWSQKGISLVKIYNEKASAVHT